MHYNKAKYFPFLLFTDQPEIISVFSANVTVPHPANVTVNQNDTVNLACIATGNPVPSITWTKLPENREVQMPFIVRGKQDEGYYRCTADNGVPFPDNRTVFIFVESEFIVFTFPL